MTTADVAPHLRLGKDGVAEYVVPVVVGVDDPSHRQPRDGADLGTQLAALGVGRSCVDQESSIAAENETDIEIERGVATPEYPVGQLVPPRLACGYHSASLAIAAPSASAPNLA